MKINKISKIFLSGLLGAFLLSACTDLVSNEKDSVSLTDTGGGFVAGDPAALLESAYKDADFFINQDRVYCLYDHTSDEMIPPTRGVDWGDNGVWRTLHQHTWDATHAYVLATWNGLNQRAFKCNQILASNPTPEQAAEAKFLRAFYMYHVMDLFGQVPFREVTEGVDVNPKVFTRAEAFEFIKDDLQAALPNLPVKGPDATNSKATKAAANALLARMFLNKAVYVAERPAESYTFDPADMNQVIAYCDAVTADGFSLEANYFTNFSTAATKEIILTSIQGSPEARYRMTLHYDQTPGGWNGFTTLADFYNKFEAQDQRIGNYPTPDGTKFSGVGRGFLVGPQLTDSNTVLINGRNKLPLDYTPAVKLSGATTYEGIRVIKYHPKDAGKYILLRYADVYLMKAEAIMRGGTAGESALDLVNALRAVRGASQLPALTEAIMLDERGRELYWEGIRRTDQVRFGTFNDTWSDKTGTDLSRCLFPIPQVALDSNPNLEQNEGY